VLAALAAIDLLHPSWLAEGEAPAASWTFVLLLPIAFAVAGDVGGTYRWQRFMGAFCDVLEGNLPPMERLRALKASGARMAWSWTRPAMSMLLRSRSRWAMVLNEPGTYSREPFGPQWGRTIPYRGICLAPLIGPAEPDPFELPTTFTGGAFPTYSTGSTGLSRSEGWAAWTEGPRMELRFARPLLSSFELRLRVVNADARNRELPVKVRAGGVEREFVAGDDPKDVTLEFGGVRDASALSFEIPSPQSPLELGQGSDPCRLSIALVSMIVVPRDAQKN
jgi:hypothetical protein